MHINVESLCCILETKKKKIEENLVVTQWLPSPAP